jgi:hypothetical protein
MNKNPIIGSIVRFTYSSGPNSRDLHGLVIDSYRRSTDLVDRYWIVVQVVKCDWQPDSINRILSIPIGGQDDAVATVIAP